MTLADLDKLPPVIELAGMPKSVGLSEQQIRNLKPRRFPIEPMRRVYRRVRLAAPRCDDTWNTKTNFKGSAREGARQLREAVEEEIAKLVGWALAHRLAGKPLCELRTGRSRRGRSWRAATRVVTGHSASFVVHQSR